MATINEKVISGTQKNAADIILSLITSRVRTDTVDGSDNKRLQVCGADGSVTRGAYISLHGNEYSGAGGELKLNAGNVATTGKIVFSTGALDRLTISDIGLATFANDVTVSGIQTNNADLVFTSAISLIRMDTTDGSDNKVLTIFGGGAGSGSRGAGIQLYGNEHATLPGVMRLIVGDVTGSSFQVYTGSTERLNINQSGIISLTLTSANQLVLVGGTSVNTRIRLSRGSDDSTQHLQMGWDRIEAVRSATPLASPQTSISFNQVGSDGTRTPLMINSDGSISTSVATVGVALDVQNPAGNNGIRVRSGNNEVNDGSEYVLDLRSGTSNNQLLAVHAGGFTEMFIQDNLTDGWVVKQGTNNYLHVKTTNGSETITIGNNTTNPITSIVGGSVFVGATPTITSKKFSIVGSGFDANCLQIENTGVDTAANGRTFNLGVTTVGASEGRLDITQPGIRTVFSVFNSGRLSVGTPTSGSRTDLGAILQVYGGTTSGAGIQLATNTTDATNKEGRLKTSHYTNSEEPITMMWVASLISTSVLSVGGASSAENAVTSIDFYTAADNITLTGTRRGGFNSSGIFDVVGNVVIGSSGSSAIALRVNSSTLIQTSQSGIESTCTFSSAATTQGIAGYFQLVTAASAFTMNEGFGIRIASATKGAGSTITTLYGLKINDQTVGASNFAIHTGLGQVQFSDIVGIGAAPSSAIALNVNNSALTGTTQHGLVSQGTFSSAATVAGKAGYFEVRTAAASFTMTSAMGVQITDVSKGAGSSITTQYGLKVENQTQGGTNYAIYTGTGLVRFGDNLEALGTATFDKEISFSGFGTEGTGRIFRTATNGIEIRGVGGSVLDFSLKNKDGNAVLEVPTGATYVRFPGDNIIIATAKTPASASATGTQGMIAWDSGFIYVCTATDTWKRVAIATW